LLCNFSCLAPCYASAICDELLSQVGEPKVVTLFQGEQPVKNFNDVLETIRPGDQLKFGDGTVFKVRALLSEGVSRIYDLGDGWLLRIPGYEHKGFGIADGIPFIRDFQKMQAELKKNGIPIVEVDENRSVPDQAVVVKKEKVLFTLEEYLGGIDHDKEELELSSSEKDEIEKKAIQFARKTWMYSYIGDFDPSQLIYNGKDWLLLDVGVNNGVFNSKLIKNLKEDRNAFTHFSTEAIQEGNLEKAPKNLKGIYRDLYKSRRKARILYEEINDAVRDERKKQRKNPELFQQILNAGTYSRDQE
jgi:hypothetical protein